MNGTEGRGHEYPPAGWTVEGLADALRETDEQYPLPTYEDVEAWETIRCDPATRPLVESVLERAESARGESVPPLLPSLFLDYARTGNRARYENTDFVRQKRLAAFAIAECIDRDGAFLDDILDYAWAICEQATWLLPAHLAANEEQEVANLPGVVPDENRYPDLRAVGIAEQLAELEYVLGDRLHPALRERIRHEIDRRVLTPYEAREDFWWLTKPTNNWNAVCNGGAAIAAMHVLDDVDRIANITVKAVRSMRYYIDEFDRTGCTTEGIGYWNYGFGSYVNLAAHLAERTDDAYSLLSPPIVGEIARYPLKVQMSPGRFLPFSDAEEDSPVFPATACWLSDRLDLEGLGALGRRNLSKPDDLLDGRTSYFLPELVRDLAWPRLVPADAKLPTPPEQQVFEGADWWLARERPSDPDTLVVAAKGGHNDESHNHNDCGTFAVHYGRESLLTDLGRPTYDRDFFSEKRYTDYVTARSLGHSVPYVNGHEQSPGSDYAADLVAHETGRTEAVEYDLTECYSDGADLKSLRRRIALHRGETRVTVTDEVVFDGEIGDVDSVLISYFPMKRRDGDLVIVGEQAQARISSDDDVDLRVEHLENEVDVSWRPNEDLRDVWRARISPSPAKRITLELSVELDGRK